MAEPLNPELTLTLRVEEITELADDIRQFRLTAVQGALPPFTPGAHILVQTPSGATRRYSLANAPHEGAEYVIAVKLESSGRGGSRSMFDGLAVGDTLFASPPRNEFELLESAPAYLFIAGGIGITPIRSMVRHLAEAGEKPFKIYYLTRDAGTTAYRDEFLDPAIKEHVVLHHDNGDPDRSYDLWPVLETPKGHHLYCCGPKGLMDAVRDMTGHWSGAAVHFEDFAAGRTQRTFEDKPFVVRKGMDGEPVPVPVDKTILEELRAKGFRIPSSCESGTCGSCRMKLLAGEADHRDLVLTDAERLSEIIVCVSRAHSPEIVVDF